MIKKPLFLRGAAVALGAALLGGCAVPYERQNEATGSVVGAVAGGLLGAQIGHGGGRAAATIVGSLAGGIIGGNVGRWMDATDRMRTGQALEYAPMGAPTAWRNPDTGYEYTVIPNRTYASAQGPCREYTMDAVVGGRMERVYGTACRQPDGSWRVQN